VLNRPAASELMMNIFASAQATLHQIKRFNLLLITHLGLSQQTAQPVTIIKIPIVETCS